MTEMEAYDPRDPAHSLADPNTWNPTRNPALIAARMAIDFAGMRTPDWQLVASAADHCDEMVPVPPEYRDGDSQ